MLVNTLFRSYEKVYIALAFPLASAFKNKSSAALFLLNLIFLGKQFSLKPSYNLARARILLRGKYFHLECDGEF